MKIIRRILVCTLLFGSPVLINQVGGPISFSGAAHAQERKQKTRRVPALREKTYKLLSEAQIMIDPESVPREEGEPAPVPRFPRGRSKDASESTHAKGRQQLRNSSNLEHVGLRLLHT